MRSIGWHRACWAAEKQGQAAISIPLRMLWEVDDHWTTYSRRKGELSLSWRRAVGSKG